MKYAYPALFTEEEGGYSVHFLDFEGSGYGCYTQGNNIGEAIAMAQDVLCMTLYWIVQDGKAAPKVSDIRSVKTEANEFVSLVSCDTDFYRRFYESKAVKKTLSIPSWLNAMAEKQKINFSQTLQEALKSQLGL